MNKIDANTQLLELFSKSCEYFDVTLWLSQGKLNQLSYADRSFLLHFITRNGNLHKIAHKNPEYLIPLADAGIDVNAVDDEGNTLLSKITDPEIFIKMLDHGAKYGSKGSFLQHAISRSSRIDHNNWSDCLPDILNRTTIDDINSLDAIDFQNLIIMGKKNKKVAEILLKLTDKLIEEKPEVALRIAKELILEHSEGLIWLIEKQIIQKGFIEQIATDPKVVFCKADDVKFYQTLACYCTPSKEFESMINSVGNFCDAAFCCAMLKTKTLMEAALLFSHVDLLTSDIPDEIKPHFVNHVQKLQEIEKDTIWQALDSTEWKKKTIQIMINLGMDPKWIHPLTKHSFLFSNRIWYAQELDLVALGFVLNHRDIKGDNALEYSCRKQNIHSIYTLSRLGLSITDEFPNAQLCKKAFPDNLVLQAFLGACLFKPRKPAFNHIVKGIPGDLYKTFIDTLKSDPQLCFIAEKIDPIKKSIDLNDWRSRFEPQDIPLLEKIKNTDHLAILASLWESLVPSSAVRLIPESPAASLVASAIFQQCNLPTTRKPLKASQLFSILTHNDVVYLFRFFFEHPAYVRTLISTYMKVKALYIQPGGGTHSTHAKVVDILTTMMGTLLQITPWIWNMPELARKIHKAFETTVAPTPKETIVVSDQSKITLQGRTVVVQEDNFLECFKFLRDREPYFYFSQEYSVSKVLHESKEEFKSKLIEPKGVYAFRSIPKPFEIYKDKLSGDGPAYVFHYKASLGKYEYLQNLPKEKYIISRPICLIDSVKLVKMGIYPDAAPIFHNEDQNRRYVVLLDLLIKAITKSAGFSFFSPAGGAGRLDQPFTKTQFPNMTETGLTDTRDAMTHNNLTHGQIYVKDMRELGSNSLFFRQMEALARILLVDMLILEQRWKQLLDWQNAELMKAFGKEIAQGLAYVFEGYAGLSQEKCLCFVLESGINWSLVAKQIAFWVDTGPKGYPGWIAQNKVPAGLYENETKVHVDTFGALNFKPETGCSTNGNQDIGLYNGPLALTEYEKSMYLLIFAVGLAEPLEKPKHPIVNVYKNY